MKLSTTTDALFLVHDTDSDRNTAARMREGAQVRGGASGAFEILIAAPHPEAEAWVAAGIEPLNDEESQRHLAEKERLGFDPVTHPHQLTSAKQADKRDTKRVCNTILGEGKGNEERWARCWKEPPLDILEKNGNGAGLRDYTRQVEEKIFSLLGDPLSR